ncbi:MAG: VOC family protein [Rhodobacteraceae bacterium]|nr:VOC family protein [Paracoccaceae bacterium]
MPFMPYIHFQGTCAEAMAFYADLFGATDLQMMRYSDAPGAEAAPSDRVMHAQFSAAGGVLMASDFPPGSGDAQAGMSVMATPATFDEGKRIHDALVKGGAEIVPFGPSFFSPGFGMVKDRFGTHWMISLAAPA